VRMYLHACVCVYVCACVCVCMDVCLQVLFATEALPKLRGLRHRHMAPSPSLHSAPPSSHLSAFDLGEATAEGCARRKLSCFKLRTPAFALVAALCDASSASAPPVSSAAAGATPHGPAESSPTEDSRHPQGSPTLSQAWGYGLLAEPLCREPDFNVIDGLSHSKDKPVSLLKNARLIADAAGRPRLLLPLPSCSMLSAQASYWILVNFQVCARALVPGLGCGSLRRGADLLRSWAGVWRGGRRQSLIIHEYARGSKKRGRKSSSSPRATCAPAENTPSSRRHW